MRRPRPARQVAAGEQTERAARGDDAPAAGAAVVAHDHRPEHERNGDAFAEKRPLHLVSPERHKPRAD